MSFLEPRVSFSSNFASFFSVMRQFLCTFACKTLYASNKRNPLKCKLSDFQLLAWKLTKFLMLFCKARISFPLNFASPFSAMTHNSSEIFCLKHYMLWTKKGHQSTFFRLSFALLKAHPFPHAIFESKR